MSVPVSALRILITVPDTVPVIVTEAAGGAPGTMELSPPPLPPQETNATKRTANATLRPINRIQDNSEDIGALSNLSLRELGSLARDFPLVPAEIRASSARRTNGSTLLWRDEPILMTNNLQLNACPNWEAGRRRHPCLANHCRDCAAGSRGGRSRKSLSAEPSGSRCAQDSCAARISD